MVYNTKLKSILTLTKINIICKLVGLNRSHKMHKRLSNYMCLYHILYMNLNTGFRHAKTVSEDEYKIYIFHANFKKIITKLIKEYTWYKKGRYQKHFSLFK